MSWTNTILGLFVYNRFWTTVAVLYPHNPFGGIYTVYQLNSLACNASQRHLYDLSSQDKPAQYTVFSIMHDSILGKSSL